MLKNIFKKKNQIEKKEIKNSSVRTWDIDYLKEFFHKYKSQIVNLSIGIYEDCEVTPLEFIKNRTIIDIPELYQTTKVCIDGVYETSWATPCIFVEFENESKIIFECYIEGIATTDNKRIWLKGPVYNCNYIKRCHNRIS